MFYWKRQILHEKVEVFDVSQHLGLRCAPRSQLRLSSRAKATRPANHPSTAVKEEEEGKGKIEKGFSQKKKKKQYVHEGTRNVERRERLTRA